jgi:saxitoxin biosynthesis operon SxtJ-like protein
MNDRLKRQQLRSFGLTVGGIFLAIGVWPVLWSGAAPRMWALALGSLLVIVGGVFPVALQPVYRAWMAIGHVMGWVNTRIILGLFFFGILTPFAFIARLLGRDFMGLSTNPDAGTYRVVRTVRPVTHVRHQF